MDISPANHSNVGVSKGGLDRSASGGVGGGDRPAIGHAGSVLDDFDGVLTRARSGAGEAFTLLYGVLAVIEMGLIVKYVKKGAEPYEEPPDVPIGGNDDDRPLAFAY